MLIFEETPTQEDIELVGIKTSALDNKTYFVGLSHPVPPAPNPHGEDFHCTYSTTKSDAFKLYLRQHYERRIATQYTKGEKSLLWQSAVYIARAVLEPDEEIDNALPSWVGVHPTEVIFSAREFLRFKP